MPVTKPIVSIPMVTPFFEVTSLNLHRVSTGAKGETAKERGVVVVNVPREGMAGIFIVPLPTAI